MLAIDTIEITADLLEVLSEIDEFKGAWRALGTIAPERLNALRRVATIESIGSSTRIEGRAQLLDLAVGQLARYYNDLTDMRGMPNTASVVQDIAFVGRIVGWRKSLNVVLEDMVFSGDRSCIVSAARMAIKTALLELQVANIGP